MVRELGGEGYQPGVERAYRAAVERLEKLGAEVVEVSCPHFEYGLAAYYLILPSEVSSNLARFDAMRYGLRVAIAGGASAEEVMALTREAGLRRPRSSGGSSSARTRSRRATTTPTTGRRRRSAP